MILLWNDRAREHGSNLARYLPELESEAHHGLQEARDIQRTGNLAEVGAVDVLVADEKHDVVGQVEKFHAHFEFLVFPDGGFLGQGEIPVEKGGAIEHSPLESAQLAGIGVRED